MLGIDAGNLRTQSAVQHRRREHSGIQSPYGENRRNACTRQSVFPVLADILEEQIAEGETPYTAVFFAADKLAHDLGVVGIAARMRDRDQLDRQTDTIGLLLQQRHPDGVHGDTVECLIDGAEKTVHGDLGILAHPVQRPGTVLTAAPREHGSRHRGKYSDVMGARFQKGREDAKAFLHREL